MLRRLGLEFARRRYEGHQREMNIDDVFAAEVPAELPHRFEKRQALDIADGAADFDDAEVAAFGGQQDTPLDLVGDMRNHLHGRAEIIAVALLLDDAYRRFARSCSC